MSKTILITGGAGFIGSHFVEHVMKEYPEHRIVVLDALTYAGSINYLPVLQSGPDGKRFEFCYGNVRNADLVNSLVGSSDIVVHFAAETHVTRSISNNLEFLETDVLGTHCIAEAVHKASDRIERFVHVSTSEVYGTALGDHMSEDHPLNPTTPYASAKCAADRLVHSYWATYGIPAVIVRPFNNYGPRQHLEKLVPRFITRALLDEDITIHGDGSASRDFVFVEDTCRAIDAVLRAPEDAVAGEAFNIGSKVDRSIQDVATDVARLMDYDLSRARHIPDRPGQVDRHTADASKIRRVLGWEPSVSWLDGLARTIAWFRESEHWWKEQLWMCRIPIRESSSGRVEIY